MLFIKTLLANVVGDVAENAVENMEFMFEPINLIKYLPKLGIGLVIIFVIIGILICITMLLNRVFSDKKKNADQ